MQTFIKMGRVEVVAFGADSILGSGIKALCLFLALLTIASYCYGRSFLANMQTRTSTQVVLSRVCVGK